ncbi:glycosyltransferase family 4 protein [Clostridium perfringens]
MNILYLTISNIDLNNPGIYSDLIKSIVNKGHNVTVVSAREKKFLKETTFSTEDGIKVLRVKVGNQFGVNFIKKGINTLLIERQFKNAIKKYLDDEEFDLVLYATPPVTLVGAIEYCKNKYKCNSYLMLKDIFPQNAVDIGLFKENGIIHKIFRNKEKKLYKISDYIGCMSNANKEYILRHNCFLKRNNVELFPNTINPSNVLENKKLNYKEVYGLNKEALIFVFGGNLGKPQGLDFLMKGIKSLEDYKEAQFLIVGSGSEKEKIKIFSEETKNVKFIEKLPKKEYENLIKDCDVGILSLDHRFTIPNYPSRILSYMDKSMPIFACTDNNTDIKELIEIKARCGKWCYSDDINEFKRCVKYFCNNKEILGEFGINGRNYLENNFNVKNSIEILESHFCK